VKEKDKFKKEMKKKNRKKKKVVKKKKKSKKKKKRKRKRNKKKKRIAKKVRTRKQKRKWSVKKKEKHNLQKPKQRRRRTKKMKHKRREKQRRKHRRRPAEIAKKPKTTESEAGKITKTSSSIVRPMNTYIAMFMTFRVRRSRGEMYISYARLPVCLSVCLLPHSHTTARTRMPGCNLEEWSGVPSSCALLGGFVIGVLASACARPMPGCFYNAKMANITSLLRPQEWLRSIVMSVYVCGSVSVSVCLCVCPQGYLQNHMRDPNQIFVHDAYVRGSVLMPAYW